MNISNYKVILASNSPRRRDLLSQVGIEYEVIPSECQEIIRATTPEKAVIQLALDKAVDVAAKVPYNSLVIGADTVVVADGMILGKPADKSTAVGMIDRLQGRQHSVYTGVALIFHGADGDIVKNFACETKVYVYDMMKEQIEAYIDTGECMDKAGAYGIQGRFAAYVEKIDGDYNNVVGLPVSRLIHEIDNMEV